MYVIIKGNIRLGSGKCGINVFFNIGCWCVIFGLVVNEGDGWFDC